MNNGWSCDMKKVEVLIATMHKENFQFVKSMNLNSDAVVVNQNKRTEKKEILKIDNNEIKWVSSLESGLSRSRNLAMKNATADICVVADDDVIFLNDYEDIITKSYKKYPEADIIAFQVERIGNKGRSKNFSDKTKWINYVSSMKISSVEITFKRKSIIDNDLQFNVNLGAGEQFYNGEENVFLYDALKKGLRILYLPIKIAAVDISESSWFEGYTDRYFQSAGAKFYNMSHIYYHLLIMQFALRKYKLYKNDMKLHVAIKEMYKGVKQYKMLHKSG